MLSSKAKEDILKDQDEGYENTALHIACSVFSYKLTSQLVEGGADILIKNKVSKTGFDIVLSEIVHYEAFIGEKEGILQQLNLIKDNLFKEWVPTDNGPV